MLEPEKLIQIVPAWLEYIRQEEMTNAEVEKGWGSYQKVFDEGVRIVGNKLLLDNSFFTQFQQQFLALKRRGHEKEFQIAVAGPQIYQVQGKGKEQRLKYLPLFTIDISPIFQGNYHKSGWDLTGFEFHPVIMNLMRLYRLEEEEAESLIVTGGLLRFLEDTFKKKFSTLQAFLNRIDLPEKYKVNRNAYLVRYNFVPFTAQLKQDLRDILQQLRQDPERCSWLSENHPAWQYLSGSPSPPRHDVMFWGAFFTHAPDEFQARGIKHAQNNCLTALWGGPGTGKTETELHLVAQQIVQRVKQLLETGKDENYLMVMSSTNNSAIRKFQNRLVLEGQTAPLYLSGGNQGIIKHSTLPLLLNQIEHLRSTQFDPHAHEQAQRAFLEALSQLQRLQEQEPVNQYQRAAAVSLVEQLDVDIQAVREDIAATEQALLSRQQQLAELSDYSQFPLEDYRQIQTVLSETWQSLPRDDNSLLKQTLDWIGGITAQRVFERLGRKINIFVLRTLSTPFPFQPPSNREQLIEAKKQVSQQITSVETWHNLKQELNSQQQRREQLEQKLADLTTHGLNILVDKKPSKLGTNLLAYHVEGSHVTQTNPQEIDGIITTISLLLSKGYQIQELGIMSPYLSQAVALKERLRATWRDFKHDDIGTVHNFQGGQKKAIVFSPYQCSSEHSFWYINRRPNLLNTAVSRAEELFIVIGNLKELENAGSETKRLIEHIRTWGEISALPSETFSDSTKQIPQKPFKKRQL